MEHWIQVLSDISLVEFVLLAVLTAWQWVLYRIRGAGWAAVSFTILGGIALVVKFAPSWVAHVTVGKVVVAVLLLMPYCLFRFATSFRDASDAVHILAVAMTAATVAFTFWLRYVPFSGVVAPPHWLAFRILFLAQCTFLFAYVVIRLFTAGLGEPPVAAYRMRLLAAAVVGLEVLVVVEALAVQGATTRLISGMLTVVTGVLFLISLVLPSFVRVPFSRREDRAFSQAMTELVSAGGSKDVGDRLLPHVCNLVGATQASILTRDGAVVAQYSTAADSKPGGRWGGRAAEDRNRELDRVKGEPRRINVRTTGGDTHVLAVNISPYMQYFGGEELRKLDQLASMVGLAIERCEMAEQIAFAASHDSLTGLANRMTAMTRGVDLVARFGGDEFVALAEVNHEEDAYEMAERIRRGLSEPIPFGDAQLEVTSSIGVVVTSDNSTPSALILRDADNAMYDAKRAGRDQVVVYEANARDVANRKWGIDPAAAAQLLAG